ncbi:Wzy-type polysaccharide biosynthesis protein UppW [Agrobacterium radiobacter]|jgi:O-antigen ligase|uniref:O-antigen ligase n=3 Tax=Agrobacterium tumefaciens TaxID=358 RepID=A0AAP9E4C8_AGRTU|nr:MULTISPECIES: Wzy-type polysaccharide biosynthesis protein UppW [Agrobacterium]AYM06250.1 exopolysaccharide production protein ExoQ [Agrobacterium tumefaciens]AYM81877.1 exopolysaccharide production protein ExoQ [Agrobacterium tumefaciens]EHH03046.1 Exopolysaccharide production protein exoQ [Agrobacterium tumefaciens CCNWGS0286]KWT83286.1 exopolysaccharide biosynthesis protein [Agrobacterium tumefaciens str. B6]MBP2567182.1 O-antigen ligase [Agrobacterium tumefaciens]
MDAAHEEQRRGYWRDALFYVTFLYFTVGFSPYISLSSTYQGSAMAAGSNLLNQLTAIILFFSFLAFMAKERSFSILFMPRLLMAAIFGWFVLTSVAGEAPLFSLRRLVMCAIICVLAGGFLQLPRTERHFTTLLATCALIILFLCYFGITVLPSRSIHQASDALEPLLAGDWRGVFRHKNEAASVMAVLIIVGIYLSKRWSFIGGLSVLLLSLVFLVKSGGKTALGLMPIIIATGWFILRWPRWRYPVVTLFLAVFALVTVGTTVDPVFSQMLTKLGLDASFTGRRDIWTVAIDYIRQSPLLGYGYQAFWRSDTLMSSFTENNTWATTAPDSHNGYFDLLLAGGVPGLMLVMVWIYLLPLQYLGKMNDATRNSPLTRLYVGVWLYVLLYGFLETLFFLSTGFVWFFLIVAVMGLHLQANASLVEDEAEGEPDRTGAAPIPQRRQVSPVVRSR